MRKQICDIYWQFAEDEIARKYEIGKRIRDNKQNYGEGFVAKVAADLDVSDTTLYSWRDVAVRYPEEEFQQIRERSVKEGKRLTWSHYECLINIRDPGERYRTLNKVFEGKLNTTQTKELVRETLNPGSGAPLRLPKPRSTGARLKTMENLGKQFLDLCETSDEGFINDILAKDKHSPQDIERLEGVQQLLQDVGRAAGERSEAIGQLLSDIRKLEAEAEQEKQDRTRAKRLRPAQVGDEETDELLACPR